MSFVVLELPLWQTGWWGRKSCNAIAGKGVPHREIIGGSMYIKFLKANFRQILGRTIP